MHNASCSSLHQGFGLLQSSTTHEPITTASHEEDVMLLLHALTSLSFLLFLAHLFLFLLTKLLGYLLHRHEHGGAHRREDVADDVVGGKESMLFWFEESTILNEEAREYSSEELCLQVEEASVELESPPCISPSQEDHSGSHGGEAKDDVVCVVDVSPSPDHSCPAAVPPAPEDAPGEEKEADEEATRHEEAEQDEENNSCDDDAKLLVSNGPVVDTKELLLEDDGEGRLGGERLASESTSKSSAEWRSSAITKDSESTTTEYPFSSSSRRSSSRWESYTLFRKYDEEMVYFHRVGAQKLTETESFRSIKYQPRSISERIVRKLAPKPSSVPSSLRDPYQELEGAYVAQICLTWEALNWNYSSFRRHNGDKDLDARCCPARVAQEFQQFQVLLQRFIENEPYEYGRRPEVYARMKNSSPKLLLVPEFREEDDEKDDLISAVQFLYILEESIRIFMHFLRGDKRSHYQMFKEMIKRRSSSVDQTLVNSLKKVNKRKKRRLKEVARPRHCLKRAKLREEEEMEVLLALIDMKVVSRVLRMPEITEGRLHWCEQKMSKVRIDLDGTMQRDPSPLFFPSH